MRLTVKPAARNDILLQLAYLAEHGGAELGQRFLHATEQSFTRLLDYPHSGTPKTFVNSHLTGVRSWPVSGFEDIRAYYLVEGDVVTILRVLHGRRDVIGILGED
ncbi:type II toxin-antitoxin system RelE/ParE family toxin [Rhizobium leguminosarum]|uniref:type II toxin-antitoxin system RelE/ParE family toxin n=1 Tax=Rhizobium leguminosarum TaxID=384 RepID=UPI0013DA3715|nr:type II toxin-antitoxin system RelE/ParE family toxin [Rhizobium leguminosarum]NEK34955.1 type II toxin-antitoxin system RelE/ParE family toxin [Rhizobium leguminosarum]